MVRVCDGDRAVNDGDKLLLALSEGGNAVILVCDGWGVVISTDEVESQARSGCSIGIVSQNDAKPSAEKMNQK